MPNYRLYRLGADGKIASPPDDFSAAADDEAISQATSMMIGDGLQACELWQGARCVAVIPDGAQASVPHRAITVVEAQLAAARDELESWKRDGSPTMIQFSAQLVETIEEQLARLRSAGGV